MIPHWTSEGESYIGSFVLRNFIESQPNWLNECQQYKTTYVGLAFTHAQ